MALPASGWKHTSSSGATTPLGRAPRALRTVAAVLPSGGAPAQVASACVVSRVERGVVTMLLCGLRRRLEPMCYSLSLCRERESSVSARASWRGVCFLYSVSVSS